MDPNDVQSRMFGRSKGPNYLVGTWIFGLIIAIKI